MQVQTLAMSAVVVLDEVHYLQDRFRGAVWEEVIIHAPRHIQMVALSATVANPAEFTDWMRQRRGPTELVIEETRPVPLESWWTVRDLGGDDALPILPMFIPSKKGIVPNPAIPRLLSRQRGKRRRFVTPQTVGGGGRTRSPIDAPRDLFRLLACRLSRRR